MNAFSATLVWCGLQVTVLSVLSAAGYLVLLRRSRSTAASVLATGFVAVAALTALSFSPWPRWWTVADLGRAANGPAAETVSSKRPSGDVAAASPLDALNRSGPRAPAARRSAAPPGVPGVWEHLAAFAEALGHAQTPAATARGSSWLLVIGWAVVAAASLLVLRVFFGLWLVRRCLRGSRAIDDAALATVLGDCRREMAVDKSVQLCASPEVTTPATVGWRRPIILLPVSWREWSPDELRAVVAHELAHVQRGDFAAGVLAELVRAVHFYHPLVHWLAGRLRLDQELAADSMAAAFTGGPRCYLGSLARLAIREDDRPMGRLVQPFLPGAGTLTRRIDMLRSKRTQPLHHPLHRSTRVLLATLSALAAVAVAGVRLPAASSGAAATFLAQAHRAAPAASPQEPQPDGSFDLRFLSPEAPPVMLLAARPAELLKRDEVKKLIASAGPMAQESFSSFEQFCGVPLSQVQQLLFLQFETGVTSEPAYVLRTTVAYNREKVLAALVTRPTEAEHRGKGYFKAAAERLLSVHFPDERTVVAASESRLRSMMTATPESASKLRLVQALANVDQNGDLLAAIDSVVVLEGPGSADQRNPLVQSLAPLWQKTTSFALSAKFGEEPATRLAVTCSDEASTESVQTAMLAVIALARASLEAARQQPPQAPPGFNAQMIRTLLDDTAKALENIQTKKQGNIVLLEAESAFNAPIALGLVLPAVQSAREAARRVTCQSNLRQIALAMHLYADRHKSLPPVAVYDENGKPMHSWRVLLLPFMGEKELYERYDMNEPWDGPNNHKLIAEMPQVYACPSGIHAAGHTDYVVMVGENTAFPPNREKGITFDEITDGTSVTFLVGEISGNANFSIPWTKPQDVEFSDTSVVPGALDGFSSLHMDGFNLTLADASARFVSLRVDRAAFRTLFTRNGGETGFIF